MKTLELTLQTREQRLVGCAPHVGRVSLFAQLPDVLTEGAMIGTLQTLRTRYALVLPQGGPWKLRKQEVERRETGVGVGDVLLELQSWQDDDSAQTDHDDDQGTVYGAPMAGQFFLRPSPEEPPFIRVGDVIEPGTQLGLVEVMKFFYPLVFEGEGQWKIRQILAQDASALEAGDPVVALEALED